MAQQFWNEVGWMLKVSIERNHAIAGSIVDTGTQGALVAKIAGQQHVMNLGVALAQLAQHPLGVIVRAVVHKN